MRGLSLVLLGAAQACFLRLEKPLKEPPFNATEEAELWRLFLSNINVNGTGAVMASPGPCPALIECCDIKEKSPYGFHWTRDASLSLMTLLDHRLARSAGSLKGSHGRDLKDVEHTVASFADWVARSHGRENAAQAFVEPKWTVAGEPYQGGWCRPQTDGPALRASLLMRAAKLFPRRAERFLALAQKDLDWLAEHHAMESCDLWEETRDADFLWNRVVHLSALAEGSESTSDVERQQRYRKAAEQKGGVLKNHVAGDPGKEFLTNCPASNQGPDCVKYNKTLDGALILSLIKGRTPDLPSLLEPVVANTVKELSDLFCRIYPVNRRDSDEGVPGVLFGRFEKDAYGHRQEGNPWVLITASLANLLYKAAQEAPQPVSPAWALVFRNGRGFEGSAEDFVAAGDAVLQRLRRHMDQEMHLSEQIDKRTGRQYNAQDLTWSYSEVLDALSARRAALRGTSP